MAVHAQRRGTAASTRLYYRRLMRALHLGLLSLVCIAVARAEFYALPVSYWNPLSSGWVSLEASALPSPQPHAQAYRPLQRPL